MWIQIFAISFFVLLLIFAIVLLSLDKNRVGGLREQLPTDLANQHLQASLVSIMRQPHTTTVGGERTTVSLASLISLNQQGEEREGKYSGLYDEQIATALDSFFSSAGLYEISIAYPNRDELIIRNAAIAEMIASDVRSPRHLSEYTATTLYLPAGVGNILITIHTVDSAVSPSEQERIERMMTERELEYLRRERSQSQDAREAEQEALEQQAEEGGEAQCISEEQRQERIELCIRYEKGLNAKARETCETRNPPCYNTGGSS
jgi:hypothetical protein